MAGWSARSGVFTNCALSPRAEVITISSQNNSKGRKILAFGCLSRCLAANENGLFQGLGQVGSSSSSTRTTMLYNYMFQGALPPAKDVRLQKKEKKKFESENGRACTIEKNIKGRFCTIERECCQCKPQRKRDILVSSLKKKNNFAFKEKKIIEFGARCEREMDAQVRLHFLKLLYFWNAWSD
jgi:hypothetical protein